MTPTSSPGAPANPPVTGDDELRLVLFGLPAAGKSSLLGALGQAAQSQGHILGGKIEDADACLQPLTRQVYDESPRRTVEEVVAYPVRFDPAGSPGETPTGLVLLDCDGQIVNDLLIRSDSLEEDSVEGSLAHEITRADGIILAIDASGTAAQIQADFVSFGKFLESLQKSRGARTEVAGLPVFLVLTKCDLLAQPGDGVAEWMDRIEQRKRDVDAHFRSFLANIGAEKVDGEPKKANATATPGSVTDLSKPRTVASPFGKIDLHIWATAVKRPALKGAPARPREPFGVAELFRQCLDEAAEYRLQKKRSHRRLIGILAGVIGLVVLMLLSSATLLFLALDSRASLLKARVEDYLAANPGGPAEHLQGGPDLLRDKRQRLEEIKDDPQFGKLPRALTETVRSRLAELEEYIPYLEKLLAEPPLESQRAEGDLQRTIKRLRDELALPRADWEQTGAGQRQRHLVESAEALNRAVEGVRNWYLDSIELAGALTSFNQYRSPAGIEWEDWAREAEKLLDPGRKLPFGDADLVPGVSSPGMTYSAVFRFDRVVLARAEWELNRARLARLLNISAALGLIAPTKDRPAVLDLPRDITLAECARRLEVLRAAYPEYQKTFTRADLPDAAVPAIRHKAMAQFRQLREPGRAEVLRQVRLAGSGSEESVKRWEPVRKWLAAGAEELNAWRELANVLLKLDDPSVADPVQALANFLAKSRFEIKLEQIHLIVSQIGGVKPAEEAPLQIYYPATSKEPALVFEPSGNPVRDAGGLLYRFRQSRGQGLVYSVSSPSFNAVLRLGGINTMEQLSWSQSRSSLYQFEALTLAPRQQIEGARPGEGRLVTNVSLVLVPTSGVPAVPELMPQVKLQE